MTPPFTQTLEDLPAPTLRRFVAAYESVVPPDIPARHRQLFPWCWQASRQLLPAPLPEQRARELFETNVLAILLNVMIDDLADLVSDDTETLEQALQILDSGDTDILEVKPALRPYLALLVTLRRELVARLKRSPAYSVWRDELLIFLGRFQVAMRRSSAWNRLWNGAPAPTPAIAFDDFLDVMAPPIHSFVYGLFALMQLNAGTIDQRSAILEILRSGEHYLAMSNWLTTWRVELAARDFTSGVIVWALERGELSPDAIRTQIPDALIRTLEATDFHRSIEQAMDERLARLVKAGQSVTAFDVSAYGEALERVHAMHTIYREVLKS